MLDDCGWIRTYDLALQTNPSYPSELLSVLVNTVFSYCLKTSKPIFFVGSVVRFDPSIKSCNSVIFWHIKVIVVWKWFDYMSMKIGATANEEFVFMKIPNGQRPKWQTRECVIYFDLVCQVKSEETKIVIYDKSVQKLWCKKSDALARCSITISTKHDTFDCSLVTTEPIPQRSPFLTAVRCVTPP